MTMSNKTYGEILNESLLFLKQNGFVYEDLRFLLMRYKEINLTEFLNILNKKASKEDEIWLTSACEKLKNNYPIQYIIGYELFFDRKFKVNENTLIPRPETEWIVDYILEHEKNQKIKVADIGTGSGVIGITLKLERENFDVTLTDIDENTLEVAKTNAKNLNADVKYKLGDNLKALDDKYDIIVSNPPYIAYSENDVMDESVKKFEPKKALFAENDGFAFYESFVKELSKYLKEDGRVYLEIGYTQGAKLTKMFKEVYPNKEINVYKDYNGNERLLVMK